MLCTCTSFYFEMAPKRQKGKRTESNRKGHVQVGLEVLNPHQIFCLTRKHVTRNVSMFFSLRGGGYKRIFLGGATQKTCITNWLILIFKFYKSDRHIRVGEGAGHALNTPLPPPPGYGLTCDKNAF